MARLHRSSRRRLAAFAFCTAPSLIACLSTQDDGAGSQGCDKNFEGTLQIDVVDAMAEGTPSLDGACNDLSCRVAAAGGCSQWTATLTASDASCTVSFRAPNDAMTSATFATMPGCDGLPAPEYVGVGPHGVESSF